MDLKFISMNPKDFSLRDRAVHVCFGPGCGNLSDVHVTVYVTPAWLSDLSYALNKAHRTGIVPFVSGVCPSCDCQYLLIILSPDLKDPILRLAASAAPDLSDFIKMIVPGMAHEFSWEK